MCGIAGFWGFGNFGTSDNNKFLKRMGLAISHRGPDNCGTWIDHNIQIGLAHQRLAIQDLSETGNQPMVTSLGKMVITFNGGFIITKNSVKNLIHKLKY